MDEKKWPSDGRGDLHVRVNENGVTYRLGHAAYQPHDLNTGPRLSEVLAKDGVPVAIAAAAQGFVDDYYEDLDRAVNGADYYDAAE